MQISVVKVTVKTLNKSIYNQLEWADGMKATDEIIGKVRYEDFVNYGFELLIYRTTGNTANLLKLRLSDYFSFIGQLLSEQLSRIAKVEEVKKEMAMRLDNIEQIFI